MALDPPRPAGPPLNALRAFEAAARHESFQAAAAELLVTPGAIAQQVKALEAWAGCALFERRANGVRLTPRGQALTPRLTEAFDLLGLAAQDLRRAAAPAACRIAALPCVAQLWLSPLLPALRAGFPALDLSVAALETPPNLLREPYDLALFFDMPPREGVSLVSLAEGGCAPVCAPALAERLKRPADLAGLTLLHDSAWRGHWPAWLRAAGAAGLDGARGPVFSLYSLAVEEAKNGAGALIGRAPLIDRALREGALVRPFDLAIETGARLQAAFRSAEGEEAPPRALARRLEASPAREALAARPDPA